jgi:hypothetical protein
MSEIRRAVPDADLLFGRHADCLPVLEHRAAL